MASSFHFRSLFSLFLLVFLFPTPSLPATSTAEPIFPDRHWTWSEPDAAGMNRAKLEQLARLVRGRGCVVRGGCMIFAWGDQSKSSDVASAFKPVLSTLLLMAVEENRLASVDEKISVVEPGLAALNHGKDANITWRHLASQTSGYGLEELPGAAYSYNDFALALYYDELMDKIFRTNGTEVLQSRLAEPLQFEDNSTFEAFGPKGRRGRLALSVRDFARFGLLYLRHGQWHSRQLIKPEWIRFALNNPIPAHTPLTSGKETEMLPGQRSVGGTRNITPVGPGYYSFNWWLNLTNQLGQRLFVDAPPDTYLATGHGGKRCLWIIPSLDLIVSWNDSPIEDHDQSPGNPDTACNRAVKLLVEAAQATPCSLGITNTQFTLNGTPVFLLGMSYYGALAAPTNFIRQDLDDLHRLGFNWIRVWANWRGFNTRAAAIDDQGRAVPAIMNHLQWLLTECSRRQMAVDLTLSRGDQASGPPALVTPESHRRAVEILVTQLRPWRNWYLDLSNERNIHDARYTSIAELKMLCEAVRAIDPSRLVTASHGGDLSRDDIVRYLREVKLDFLTPHRPRAPDSPAQTLDIMGQYLVWVKEVGPPVPVLFQEPFRRGYGSWNPTRSDYVMDLEQSRRGGAAGWCFHNGAQRQSPGSEPRRCFDLSTHRLFDQLDPEERAALERIGSP